MTSDATPQMMADRVLELTRVILNSTVDDARRFATTLEVDSVLRDLVFFRFLQNQLASVPLGPAEHAALPYALDAARFPWARHKEHRSLYQLLLWLEAVQQPIHETCESFEALPAELFRADEGDREPARRLLIRDGVFRELAVVDRDRLSLAQAAAYVLTASEAALDLRYQAMLVTWLQSLVAAAPPAAPSFDQSTLDGYLADELNVSYGGYDEEARPASNARANLNRIAGAFDLAAADYRDVLLQTPHDLEALVGRAGTLRDMGCFAEAATNYDQALAIEPGHLQAHLERADVLRRLGRLEESLTDYDHVLASTPRPPVLSDGGVATEHHGSEYHMAQIRTRAERGRALTLAVLGRAQDALLAYEGLHDGRARDMAADYGRARLLAASGQWREALALLSERKASWRTCHARATILLRAGYTDVARAVFTLGAQHLATVERTAFRIALAVTCLRSGEPEEVVSLLQPVSNRTLEPLVDALLMHTDLLLDDNDSATRRLAFIPRVGSPQLLALRHELRACLDEGLPAHDNPRLFNLELELLDQSLAEYDLHPPG